MVSLHANLISSLVEHFGSRPHFDVHFGFGDCTYECLSKTFDCGVDSVTTTRREEIRVIKCAEGIPDGRLHRSTLKIDDCFRILVEPLI